MHVRFRYLNGDLGLWGGRDPLEYDANALNLYEYVSGSPLNIVDSHGLFGSPFMNFQGCHSILDLKAGFDIPKWITGLLKTVGLPEVKPKGGYSLNVSKCNTLCKTGCSNWAPGVSGKLSTSLTVDASVGFELLGFDVTLGPYIEGIASGNLGFSYNGCSDRWSGSGCIGLAVEMGVIGKISQNVFLLGEAGGGVKAGIGINANLCVSCDSECVITLTPCFNAKVKMWAFVKWNLFGSVRERAFSAEHGASACAQPLIIRRISK